MLLVRGLRLPLDETPETAIALAIKRCGLAQSEVAGAHLHKISVDARRQRPVLEYTVALALSDPHREALFHGQAPAVQPVEQQHFSPRPGGERLPGPVVICGLGPAGLFCALALARAGFAPTVLERGPEMAQRRTAVEAFEKGGPLCEEANIQFGEGGAGTFSDGKLTSRIGDPLCGWVLRQMLNAGAPQEIAYRARPHIGTDKLRAVFVNLRRQLLAAGGQVLFNTRLTALTARNGRLCGVQTAGGLLPAGVLVLASGHSARDTFLAVDAAGVPLAAKTFSVGLRAEHLQQTINEGLYHGAAGHPALPPGEYRLSTRHNGRGVYTFCMCPGGSVVAAASENGGVVTNGMSLHARNGPNANAAVVANVGPDDFGNDPFEAIAFQRRLEQAAFAAGGGSYAAPAETLGSFMEGAGVLRPKRVQPSYPRGVAAANLGALLPLAVAQALRTGFKAFGRKLPGYDAADTVLTGLETRTSCPVRIERGEGYESAALPGLYPCGEGAGYAGGIMSAAVDGLRVATAIIERYSPNTTG